MAVFYPLRHISVGKQKHRKEKLSQRATELPNQQDSSTLNHGCLLAKGTGQTTLSPVLKCSCAEGELSPGDCSASSPSLGKALSAFP